MATRFTDIRDNGSGIRYLHAFAAHWRLIALLIVLAVTSAATYTALATKKYNASADVLVTPVPSTDTVFQGFSLFRVSLDGSSSVVTAARVMKSPQIHQEAFKDLPNRGAGVSINVVPLSQADIVTIQATAPTAGEAAQAANAYAQAIVTERTRLFKSQLGARIAQVENQLHAFPRALRNGNFAYIALEQELSQLRGSIGLNDPTLQLLTAAVPPTAASWPRPKLSIVIAFLVALLLGAGAAIFLETNNPRLTRESELTLEHRLPVLARIPRVSRRVAEGYLTGSTALPQELWKPYQTLRAVLATAGRSGAYPRSILVTSATPNDGKTMTAVNLAIALAAADMSVVLIDGDFHRPMIGTIFDAKVKRDGLVRLLRGEAGLQEASIPAAGYPGLRLVLSTSEQMHDLNILEGDGVAKLLRELEKAADVVVIDTPPIPEVAEALWLAAVAEVVVLCVRVGHTRRDRLEQLRELLGRRGIAPLGFVVTTRERPEPEDAAYGYRFTTPDGRSGLDSPRTRARAAAMPLRQWADGHSRPRDPARLEERSRTRK
jgi:capsular exopolysaccharide synthesis family protein